MSKLRVLVILRLRSSSIIRYFIQYYYAGPVLFTFGIFHDKSVTRSGHSYTTFGYVLRFVLTKNESKWPKTYQISIFFSHYEYQIRHLWFQYNLKWKPLKTWKKIIFRQKWFWRGLESWTLVIEHIIFDFSNFDFDPTK